MTIDILCLCTPHSMGGAQNNAARLVHAFRSRGYAADLGFLFEHEPEASFIVDTAFVVFPKVPSRVADWGHFILQCRREISVRCPKVTFGFHPFANIVGALFTGINGGRFISRQAWPASEQSRSTQRMESLLMRTPFVTGNIAVSQYIASSFSHWGSAYTKKTTVIHNNPPTLPNVDETTTVMRRRLGINEGTLILGCLGRLHPQKNFQLAIRAMAYLPTHIHLYVAGRGEQRDILSELAKEIGVADRVHFLGPLVGADVVRFYRSIDMLLMPSLFEGHPMVMLEAMSQGTPVIAHDVDVMREAGGDAPLYASEHPTDWARRVLAFDKVTKLTMADLSRARAAHFSETPMVDNYLRKAQLPPFKT